MFVNSWRIILDAIMKSNTEASKLIMQTGFMINFIPDANSWSKNRVMENGFTFPPKTPQKNKNHWQNICQTFILDIGYQTRE